MIVWWLYTFCSGLTIVRLIYKGSFRGSTSKDEEYSITDTLTSSYTLHPSLSLIRVKGDGVNQRENGAGQRKAERESLGKTETVLIHIFLLGQIGWIEILRFFYNI